MNPDPYDDRDDWGDEAPADWPPGKPGRPYGVYPTPPGLVRAPGEPPDPGTAKGRARPAENQAVIPAATRSAAEPAARAPSPAPAAPASEPIADAARGATGKPLRPRQERFCQFYAITGNATEAAWQAGYSFPASRNQGYRLLRRPEIQARVAELQRAFARAARLDHEVMLGKLEAVYRQAVEGGYLNAAARVVEIQGRVASQLRSVAPLPPAPPTAEKDEK